MSRSFYVVSSFKYILINLSFQEKSDISENSAMSTGMKSRMTKLKGDTEWAELMKHQARVAHELINKEKEAKKLKHQEVRYN